MSSSVRKLIPLVAVLPVVLAGAPVMVAGADTTVADLNAVGVTLTNYGGIGNNFISRAPSLEYPLGSGYEHLTMGGLWFGAHAVDQVGEFVGVSIAAQEGQPGTSTEFFSEFTPGAVITRHSNNVASPYYDPTALSEMDYRWTFSDEPAKTVGIEPARPLKILVRGSAYSWTSGARAHFLILRYTVINQGPPLTGAWAGLWAELASGNKNSYSCWPPSSACSATGSWFSKKWVQYDDSRRLVREHYCFGQPVPGGCVLSRVPAWMGVQVLSHQAAGQQITLAAWSWSPGNLLRDEDVERYAIMSAGTIQDLTQPDFMPQSGDPVELLAMGPFASIAAGDSVTVDFALVGGAEVADIQAHADSAQAFYDQWMGLGSQVGVEPAPVAGFALAGAQPNPSPGRLMVAFSLPDAEPARIELWDVAGRRVAGRDVGMRGAGHHVVDLSEGRLPAGVYLIRLTRGSRELTARAVVVR